MIDIFFLSQRNRQAPIPFRSAPCLCLRPPRRKANGSAFYLLSSCNLANMHKIIANCIQFRWPLKPAETRKKGSFSPPGKAPEWAGKTRGIRASAGRHPTVCAALRRAFRPEKAAAATGRHGKRSIALRHTCNINRKNCLVALPAGRRGCPQTFRPWTRSENGAAGGPFRRAFTG